MINQVLASSVFSATSTARRVFAAVAVSSIALAAALSASGCAADTSATNADPAATAHTDEAWDSQGGNPTHATHSYLTEYAVDNLSGWYPELATYRSTIVDAANQELHELPITNNPEEEALRVEVEGTNWACNHPERAWAHAKASYAAGDKQKAYWYVGIILHWVEDMGVPAHAFHVYHQGTLGSQDNFELLGLQRWAPSYSAISASYPYFTSPSDYVAWSGTIAANDFNRTFPGQAYYRTFFSSSWFWISSKQATFFHNREGTTATIAYWALYSAVTNF